MFLYSHISSNLLFIETEYQPKSIRVIDADGCEVNCPVLAVKESEGKYQSTLDASALTPWSVNEPVLYTLETETESVRFGHTQLRTVQNKAVLLNEKPIYLRGYIRGIIAHDHPNMTGGSDYEAALKNISQAKKYGFNFVRFHSTIPSEDFVRAADELGLLIHMEIGFSYEVQPDGSRQVSANNALWTETILRYRNHPSVAVFCIGNEMHNSGHFPVVKEIYKEGRRLAPSKLIMDNTGWGEYDRSSADIFSQHIAYYFPYKHHADMFKTDAPWMLNGSVSDEPLDLQTEESGVKTTIHREATPLRPMLSHEAIHYIDVIDYDALAKKYDDFAAKVGPEYLEKHGIKKPRFMTELPELIRRKGLTDYMPDYIKGSRLSRLSAMKVFLERLRLSQLCGYEMLQFSDCLKYENKNGIVDCFDDDKGIDAAWMRKMNSDLVVVADLNDEVFYEDDPIVADIYASDFLPESEITGDLRVTLDGVCVYEGHQFILAGGLQKLVHLEMQAPATGAAHCSVLKAEFTFDGGAVENEWNLWFYPHVRPAKRPELHLANEALKAYLKEGTVSSDTYVTDTFDESVFKALEEKKTVVLFYEYGAERNTWQMPGALERYKPCIWDRGSNLGGVVANEALQKTMSVGRYFDLNMQPVLELGTKVNLDHFPCPVEEHLRGIDKPARDRLQGLVRHNKSFIDDDTLRRFSHLFSLKVGEGLLIVCTLNVNKPENPVASGLLTTLIDHPEAFATDCAIDEAALRAWLDETNAAGFRREDIMNHFWELDNKPVEDTLFWEEYGIDLADLK